MKKTIDIVLKTLGVLSLFQLVYGLLYVLFPERFLNAHTRMINKIVKFDFEED